MNHTRSCLETLIESEKNVTVVQFHILTIKYIADVLCACPISHSHVWWITIKGLQRIYFRWRDDVWWIRWWRRRRVLRREWGGWRVLLLYLEAFVVIRCRQVVKRCRSDIAGFFFFCIWFFWMERREWGCLDVGMFAVQFGSILKQNSFDPKINLLAVWFDFGWYI